MKGTIQLQIGIEPVHQHEIEKNLYWIDSKIRHAKYRPGSTDVIEIDYAGDAIPESTAQRVVEAATNIIRSIQRIQFTTFYDNQQIPIPYGKDPMPELEAREWVRPMFAGGYAYSGLFLKLYRSLDHMFRNDALSLHSQEHEFPSLLSCSNARRLGYFESYPQNLNIVQHVHEDLDHIRRVKDILHGAKGAGSSDCLGEHLAQPDAILAPNICYHFWCGMADKVIPDGTVQIGTAAGLCHRYEGKATTGLKRLREFFMREVFAVGPPQAIVELRDRMLDKQIAFLESFSLAGVVKTASDPFFVDNYSEKRIFQVGQDLKFEVRASLPFDNDSTAISSVNFHQDYFTKIFNIRSESGEPLNSCCLAYGLERWCLAVFAQYGMDVEKWPSSLRKLIETSN